MGHVPMTHGVDINPALAHGTAKVAGLMGVTAEALAGFTKMMNPKKNLMRDGIGKLLTIFTELLNLFFSFLYVCTLLSTELSIYLKNPVSKVIK